MPIMKTYAKPERHTKCMPRRPLECIMQKKHLAAMPSNHLPLPLSCPLARTRRRNEPSSNLHPLWNTTSLLALHIHNIRITPTPASHPILFLRIPFRPILVFFPPTTPLLFQHRRAEGRTLTRIVAGTVVRCSRHLARGCVGWAVLDGRVPVANVAEVVDLVGGEEGTRCEGVDRCVAPL